MEQAATALGRRYAVADIIVGALVLAVVTSPPNAVTAVYLARRGRGAAVLSTALNSNAINVTAGLLVPASLTGLGPRSGQDILVAAWDAGPDPVRAGPRLPRPRPGPDTGRGDHGGLPGVRDRAAHQRGAGKGQPGGRRAFSRRRHGGCRCPAPDPVVALAAIRPHADGQPGPRVAASIAAARMERRAPVGPQLHPVLRSRGLRRCQRAPPDPDRPADRRPVLRAADRPLGPHRHRQLLGVPDQIFATVTQYAFLAAIAAVSMTATISAVILQRQRP